MSPRRRSFAALLAAATLGWAGCGSHGAPDVVVITLDTVRADRLGCYGNRDGLTPHLDAFAAQSTVFEDASCVTPVTLPSHASLFTGRYPTGTGVRNNGSFVLPAGETTLAEILRARGWSTGAVIASFPLQSRYGLAQGFDVYDEELPPLPNVAGQAFSVHFMERDARAVTDRALDVWSRWKAAPRFLWVHYFDAHAPYAPPEPWAGRHAAAPYDGEIAYVDAELSRLLDRIRRDAPDAIVIVAGDHGESLGEHGEKTHGIFLYQSTLHVPLVVRAPGRWPEGARVAAPVSLVDVVPTVLTLVGIPVPDNLDGTDLAPAAHGKKLARREVYAESYLPLLQFRFSQLTMLREGPLKYIDAPAAELYDVRADASESRNLAAGHPDRDALAERLSTFVAHADPEASERAAGALDVESEARLRSLGYTSAGTLDKPGAPRGRDPKTMTGYLQRYDRAVGLVSSGKIDEGLDELRKLLPEAPENYMTRYQVAAALIAAGRQADARDELEQVVAAAPEFGNGHLMLAECLAALGRVDDAIRSFEAAAERMPTQAEPKLAEGRALEGLGRFDAAAEAYRAAIEREPGGDEAARALLALRTGRGDRTRAVTELDDLARRFPNSAALATVLAEARRRGGDLEGALLAARGALAIDPSRTGARMVEAGILFEAGRPSEAASSYRKVLAAKPGMKPAELGLARALVAASDAQAEPWIAELASKYPRDAGPAYLRGMLLEARGDRDGAVQAYRSALVLDPRNADSRRALDRLAPTR